MGNYWLIYISTAIAIITIVAAAFIYFVKKEKQKSKTRESDIYVNSEFERINTNALPSLIPIIKYFKGNCNSLLMVSNNPRNIGICKDVFDYTSKVFEYHASEGLKIWWNNFYAAKDTWDMSTFEEKAKLIVSMIQKAGVTVSAEQLIEWNENASLHYVALDSVEEGDRCRVIYPFWTYKNEIFEQGLVSNNK